jgi:photosystem II protein
MAASVMASLALKPSQSQFLDRSRFPGVKSSSAFKVMAKKIKKIQTSRHLELNAHVLFHAYFPKIQS